MINTTGTWRAIDEGSLWCWEKVFLSGWSMNTLALRLQDAQTLVISPTRGMNESDLTMLRGLGEPSFVLAPNHYHWLGIEAFRAQAKSIRVTASSQAGKRLEQKLGYPLTDLAELRAELLPNTTILEPPGLANGEVFVELHGVQGCTWIVSDAFFNSNRPLSGRFGLLLRLTRTAPGLCLGRTFRWVAVGDAKAYKTWILEALETRRPTRLLVSHGDMLEGADLHERLAVLVKRYL